MDPPQPRPDMAETIEWIELWLEMLDRDPTCGPTVLPFAQADLKRLKGEFLRQKEGPPPSEETQALARRALRLAGELAVEIMKRWVNGDICGTAERPRLAAA